MTAFTAGAASGGDIDWLKIDWGQVRRSVRRVQLSQSVLGVLR